jgi:hypothetical protein
MAKKPEIGAYLDDEEKQIIEAVEADDAVGARSHESGARKNHLAHCSARSDATES